MNLGLLLLVSGSYCIDQGIGCGIADERVLDVRFGEVGIGRTGLFVSKLICSRYLH